MFRGIYRDAVPDQQPRPGILAGEQKGTLGPVDRWGRPAHSVSALWAMSPPPYAPLR